MMVDMERRSRAYKSPDIIDHPDDLMWDFDFFHQRYGNGGDELSPGMVARLYEDICADEFPYDVLLVDNVAMFQEELYFMIVGDPNTARATTIELARAFRGVEARHARFLSKFKTTSAVDIYGVMKSIIAELLRMCQRKGIDVIWATESKNVWQNYGKSNMKILGQTAKLLAPWMKYADFIYRLNRTLGSRDTGNARLIEIPHAITDTFNPKNSLPGLKPTFEMTWPAFWEMVNSRTVTTQDDLDKVRVETSEEPEYGGSENDLEDAKKLWMDKAIKVGLMKSATDQAGVKALLGWLFDNDPPLTPDDALAQTQAGLDRIGEWSPV